MNLKFFCNLRSRFVTSQSDGEYLNFGYNLPVGNERYLSTNRGLEKSVTKTVIFRSDNL
jgi:hypothetical protein